MMGMNPFSAGRNNRQFQQNSMQMQNQNPSGGSGNFYDQLFASQANVQNQISNALGGMSLNPADYQSSSRGGASSGANNNLYALDALADRFSALDVDHDGNVTFNELAQANACNPQDSGLHQLVSYLRTSGLFNKLSGLNSDNQNEGFSQKDVEAGFSNTSITSNVTPTTDLQSAMGIINAHLDIFTDGDPTKTSISSADILSALDSDDPKYTSEIKSAAQYLKDHSDQLKTLDSADGVADNNIAIDVIKDATITDNFQADYGFNDANKSAATNKEALQIFQNMLDKLDQADANGTSADKLIGENDMRAALSDNTGKFTSKEKAVLNYVFNTQMKSGDQYSTLWESMDGGDNLVGTADMLKALQNNFDPSETTNDSNTDYK